MSPDRSEFSRLVEPNSLDEQGTSMTIEADAGERARLAERFGLVALDSFSATLRLTPEKGGHMVRLEGTLTADVIQSCVVTLEPLKASLETAVERLYDTAAEAPLSAGAAFDFDAQDPPEAAPDGRIDIGEAAAEELALALNPFPRKPDITFSGYASGRVSDTDDGDAPAEGEGGEPAAPGGPFAILETIKKKFK
ncbi:MAG: YceD family protein [Rhodospirillales bacterium]